MLAILPHQLTQAVPVGRWRTDLLRHDQQPALPHPQTRRMRVRPVIRHPPVAIDRGRDGGGGVKRGPELPQPPDHSGAAEIQGAHELILAQIVERMSRPQTVVRRRRLRIGDDHPDRLADTLVVP